MTLIRNNRMKKINSLLILFSILLVLGACEKDGDKYFLSSLTENELIASSDAVTLTEATAKLYALSFAWTDRTLQVSYPNAKAPNILKTTLQVSLTEDFSGTVVESTETGLSKSYTVAALNIVANSLGATGNVSSPFYFRLKGTTGDNMDPVYSNVEKVDVTPYELDMRFGKILDTNAQSMDINLFSPNTNGIYSGFIGATSWMNFLFQEADGTTWRTANSGGIGSPFILTTEGTWGLWFPSPAGCYYVNFNTPASQWTALYIPSLTVKGIEGLSMSYNRPTNEWKGTFTATTPGNLTIQIDGTGKLYNNRSVTGSDNSISDDLAADTPFAFSGNADQLALVTDGTTHSITVNVPEAGECTLTINLSDPQNCTVNVTAGGNTEPTYPEYLEMQGTDSWWGKFNVKLTADKTAGTYRSVFQTTDGENFKIVEPTSGTWYGSDPSDLYKLSDADGNYNLWFESSEKKSYMVNVDFAHLTWTPSEIKQINVYGDFNNWDLTKDKMTYDTSTGTWSATCEVNTIGYGFYFLLNSDPTNLSWDWALKGTLEEGLYLTNGDGSGNILPAETGTYLITLDIHTMTFTMTKQ